MNTSTLFFGSVFGSIGAGFVIYGKKQQAIVPLLCGLALMVFPYFIDDPMFLVATGVGLMSIPYFVRL